MLPNEIAVTLNAPITVISYVRFNKWEGTSYWEHLLLSYGGQRCKVKIPKNMVPRSILKFWNYQYLVSKFLEGFHVKMDLWITLYTNILPRFSNIKIIFHKVNFSPICYDIINEITTSRERNVKFQNGFAPKLGSKNSPEEIV